MNDGSNKPLLNDHETNPTVEEYYGQEDNYCHVVRL